MGTTKLLKTVIFVTDTVHVAFSALCFYAKDKGRMKSGNMFSGTLEELAVTLFMKQIIVK